MIQNGFKICGFNLKAKGLQSGIYIPIVDPST